MATLFEQFKEDIDRATETADKGEWMTCGRVWEAWGVGTMTQDDFQLVSEDEGSLGDLVNEIKQSYLNAIDVMMDLDIRDGNWEYLQEQRKQISAYES